MVILASLIPSLSLLVFLKSPYVGESTAIGSLGMEGELGAVSSASPEALSTSVLVLSVLCLMVGFWMIRFSFARRD